MIIGFRDSFAGRVALVVSDLGKADGHSIRVRCDGFSSASPQSPALRSCFLEIGSWCQAGSVIWALASRQWPRAAWHSAQAGFPAGPAPAGCLFPTTEPALLLRSRFCPRAWRVE